MARRWRRRCHCSASTPELYDLLVQQCHWDVQRYVTYIEDCPAALLLRGGSAARAH